MKVKDVILECNGKVPFPWTPRKLKRAGFEPSEFLLDVGRRLEQCEDKDTPAAEAVLDTIKELGLL